ncbi:hypothetical protein L202_00801 [Cryptococcus amylolentus CBS 6039]|uniref:Integral membrane protein n=1 Tax=Cryptococcus amylolentus CBS 6039 TaxID=1295533 RepID=A0A1E3I8Q6_9TREE|nr:hypothetical protein L202_00801 [Cryptococcus amylolentus CBS 6039]ODN84957.1 hypothetical protein L202_00801 [Cryptococcus amylolentus CBS 6039]
MGNISSALDSSGGKGVVSVPDGYTAPQWPSLYIPTLDSTNDQRGIFLYEAEAIWRFTLYWTLLLLCSLFLLCSTLASFTLLLSLTVFRPSSSKPLNPPPSDNPAQPAEAKLHSSSSTTSDNPVSDPNNATPLRSRDSAHPAPPKPKILERAKRKRPPLWPVLILPLVATALAAGVALVTGTVVGFALAAVYSAAGFSMSTWVPFLWALVIALVLIISSYSTLTSIL